MSFSPQQRETSTYGAPLSKRAATDVADVVSVASRLSAIEEKLDYLMRGMDILLGRTSPSQKGTKR
jgi:hypothetical protein